VPQENLEVREIDQSRGKGLAGTTAINFCLDQRAQKKVAQSSAEYGKYVHLGNKVSKSHWYCPISQSCSRILVLNKNRQVDIGFPDRWDPAFGTYLDNAYHDGYPQALDVNSGNPIGLDVIQFSISNRSRVTAATAFLADKPANLTIMTGHVVEKVVHDGQKIIGVAIFDQTSMCRLFSIFIILLTRR